MRFLDAVGMCGVLLFRHRRRYKNVVAVIAAGTVGLVITIAIGHSVEEKLMNHIDVIGGATIIKLYWNETDLSRPHEFFQADVTALRALNHVAATAPLTKIDRVQAWQADRRWLPALVGVDEYYWSMTYSNIINGRPISKDDVSNRSSVCVVSPDVAEYLFGYENPLQRRLLISGEPFEVIGCLGGVEMRDSAHEVYIPISVAYDLFEPMREIKEILVRVNHVDNVGTVLTNVMAVIRKNHAGASDLVRHRYFPERIGMVQSILRNFKVLVVSALTVTVLVGALGIARVMLAAIQERTREIGLRKALGASEEEVRCQFLTESVLISASGGVLGASLGLIVLGVLLRVADLEVSCAMVILALVASVAMSVVLGIVAGLHPSARACRMDAVTAMRFE